MYTKTPLFILLCLAIFACSEDKDEAETKLVAPNIIHEAPPMMFDSLHINEALKYCSENGYATDFSILINLAHFSGHFRLFAMNLESGDTLVKGLVAHGHCKGPESRLAQFSNEIGSNCSSLGKYRIGGKYNGEYGTSFKLYGLNETNSNAANRFVVLHGHECVPDTFSTDDICLSEGCPTVSPTVLTELESYIEQVDKPILLWIFSDTHQDAPTNPSTEDLQEKFFNNWKSSKK